MVPTREMGACRWRATALPRERFDPSALDPPVVCVCSHAVPNAHHGLMMRCHRHPVAVEGGRPWCSEHLPRQGDVQWQVRALGGAGEE